MSGFTATPARLEARVFRELPLGGSQPVASVPVGFDGTWAFSDLPAWDHYFVQAAADFGQAVAAGAVVGPLSIPASGASTDVTVVPVQLTIIQQSDGTGPMQLQSAIAYVFDPASGAPADGATVTIDVGGTPVPMPGSTQSGAAAYTATFPAQTAAQASYTVTTLLAGAASSHPWTVSAGTASFAPPSLTAPAGTTVPQGKDLAVSWSLQTAADDAVVLLYAQQGGSWVQTWEQSPPADADATTATIPASYVTAGAPLLLEVLFAGAHCATGEAGCVVNDETATVQVTAQ